MTRLLAMGLIVLGFSNACFGDASTRPLRSPREMLQVMKIDESLLSFFRDDRAVNDDEQEPLMKLLLRLPHFAQQDVDRWAKPIEDAQAILVNPDSYRFDMHALSGQVSEIERLSVLPELVPRLRFAHFYKVSLTDNELESTIYCRSIPRKWRDAFEERTFVGESVRVQGLLLKRMLDHGKQVLVFAASRLNWHPTQPSRALAVSNDHVLLSQLGVDIDRFSDVVHKAGLESIDRECFYQCVAAVRMAEPDQLARLGSRRFDIARMIQTPSQVCGELYTLKGIARRAIRIQVDDVDIRSRFGIDHYYELEVFVPLEKQVRFLDPGESRDQEGKVFTDYPFVICVPQLPAGMQTGSDVRVPLTFSGFFVKLWAYRTEFMSGKQPRNASLKLQQSPLLIGPTVTLEVPPEQRESDLSVLISSLAVVSLMGIWLVLWRASIHDRARARQLFRKHDPQDPGFNLWKDRD